MIRLVLVHLAILTALLGIHTRSSAGADPPAALPPATAPATSPADETKTKAPAPGDLARPDHSLELARPGEEPVRRFVPLHPRGVEERKRNEAVVAFSVARALEERHEWAQAITVLEDARKLDPDSITILRRLSRLCFVLGRTEPGILYSKKVLDLDPDDSETISRLVNYHLRKKDPGAAEKVLLDVLANPRLGKMAAGRLVAGYELGRLYAGPLRQVDKAADQFAKVVEALDDRAANRLSPADQRRILGDEESRAYQDFGLVFLQAKRYDLAVKSFERGLVYEPEDAQLPLLLAQTMLKADRPARALEVAEAFLKRQPQGVEGYEVLAKALTALHRGAEITPRIEKAAELDSKNVALQYVLVDRYRETGQGARADALEKKLIDEQPSLQGYHARAASLLKQGKADDLLKVIAKAIGHPGGLEAVQDQIKALVDDPVMSGKVLDAGLNMLKAEPESLDRRGLQLLGHVATRAGKLDKFLPVQRLALAQNPSAPAYRELVDTLIKLKKYAEGTALLEEMLKKYPAERNASQLVLLAMAYRQANKPEAAVAAARDAVKLDPADLEARVQLAIVLSQTGKSAEAVDLLKAALKKEPTNPVIAGILGSVLTQSGRNEEALAVFQEILDKFPTDENAVRSARSNLSNIYVNMGNYAKGEKELETLLERNADDPGVNNDLGYLYAEQGKNLEKAETMIRKAVHDEPDNSAFLDSLGWVLFKRGKAREAVAPLEKAVKHREELGAEADATILEHLGDVFFELKETAKAKATWLEAEKIAAKATPPDKRLPEIRKKLGSLEKLGNVPRPSTGSNP